MDIRNKLKEIRKELCLSQEKLAKELNVDYCTVSRIERGVFKPSYKFIEKLKMFCDKNNIYFYDDSMNVLRVDDIVSKNLYEDIMKVINDSYNVATKTVNYLLVQRNYLIGKRIAKEVLTNKKDDYGKQLIKELSKNLIGSYGNGFSERNLYYYLDFYYKFPNILNTVCAKSFLSWSHYRVLLQLDSQDARNWYANECLNESWSVRTLQRNISSQYYERLLSSHVKEKVHNEMVKVNNNYQINKLDYIKDPMILEFLGINEDNTYLESDIESSILTHIQKFIMELGKGYAFVARQKRIHTEKEDYYIDLVFYNYLLKCFVLIDLKTSKITHQDVGQMDMYIRIYDELIKEESDNPTLGIVLCSDTDEDIAKYSVMHGNEQLFASKYKLYLPTEAELKKEIEKQKAIQILKINN